MDDFDFWQDAKDNLKKDIAERWNKYFSAPDYRQGIKFQNSVANEFGTALGNMTKTYFQMRRNNIIKSDDYYHCKANYLASRRGAVASLAAKIYGDVKENFDYYKNILYKDLSPEDAFIDKNHDLSVNKVGLRAGKLFPKSSARKVCGRFIVKGMERDEHF